MNFNEALNYIQLRNNINQTPDYPKNMTEVGMFTFLRTYSRYIPEKKRRETWRETVERAVAWSISLDDGATGVELENLFDAVFNLHIQLAGRTLWTGGTEVSEKYPLSNFNCTFTTIENIDDLCDLFYLSMLGSGVGFSVEEKYVRKFPLVREIDVIHGDYDGKPKNERAEHSSLKVESGIAVLEIGDSKEGWTEALKMFFEVHTNPMYNAIDELLVVYDNVRPKGERLRTFGGFASGHEYLQRMFEKIATIISERDTARGIVPKGYRKPTGKYFKLKPIDMLDICNIIGENVVSGGVRRTAQISLFDNTQDLLIDAKSNLYMQDDAGNWVENEEIIHRRLSNNSILYYSKPSLNELIKRIETIKTTGEPAFINAEQATRRFKEFQGVNPCAEILLRSKECCNLVAVDLALAYRDGCGQMRMCDLFRLATRHCFRITTLDLELPRWREVLHEDRLLGVSLNGLIDYKNMSGKSNEELGRRLREFREYAHIFMKDYAEELGLNPSKNVTTIKPTGTQSLLGGMSAGVHNQWGEYFIRRIRLSKFDPIYNAMKEMGYKMVQDTGSEDTYVVEFPCKSSAKRTINEISAIEQLEMYKLTMENYTDQNTSCTINVGSDEWEDVASWMYLNWDSVVGVSFLHKTENYFPLLPYEAITKEVYEEMISKQPKFRPEIVDKHDDTGEEFDISNDKSCATGHCPLK